MSKEYIERGALMIEIEKHIETIGASAENSAEKSIRQRGV